MEQYVIDYFGDFVEEMYKVSWKELAKAVKILAATHKAGGKVYVIGNGGSSAIASHWANDLNKTVLGHKGNKKIKRFQAICLSDNTPVLTAWANDVGYEHVFAEQLKNFIEPKDTLIVVSSSGNSSNIIRAIKLARKSKVKVVALVGFDGGKAKALADAVIHVPSHQYGLVEPIHDAMTHLITNYFTESL